MAFLELYGASLGWLIALVLLLILEAVTVGLTSIWFAAGALCALLVSLVGDNIWLEITVFLVVSLLALFCVRPLAKRYFHPRQQATNADRAIGKEAVVTETIDNLNGAGQVTVGGVFWTARAAEETPIPKGALVRVLRIEGVKLIVAAEVSCVAAQKEEE